MKRSILDNDFLLYEPILQFIFKKYTININEYGMLTKTEKEINIGWTILSATHK